MLYFETIFDVEYSDTMFKFNFLNEEDSELPEPLKAEWFEAKEVMPDLTIVNEILSTGCVNLFRCGREINLKYISPNVIDILVNKKKHSPIFKAEKDYSDLITGIYEGLSLKNKCPFLASIVGGLKIWECTYDLVKYISDQRIDLHDKTVLDLGCGSGIIGILALIKGCHVNFQDYNEEIIQFVTIPNVFLNKSDISLEECRFFAGDWNSFLSLTSNNNSKYDYIFTCETIYNPENYRKLHEVFKHQLKRDGVIYLAAKTYYFGVGGSLRQFEDFLREEGVFTFKTCWTHTEGVAREILKISFKDSKCT